MEPRNLPGRERKRDSGDDRPAVRNAERADEKPHKAGRQRQMENDAPPGRNVGRQKVEQEVAGIEDRRLAVRDEGRPAKLVWIPEWDGPGANGVRRELPPG